MSTVTPVAASLSVMTLLAADNDNFRKASVYYDGAAIMYVLVGSGTPSSTNFSFKMGDGYLTYWEHPDPQAGDPVKAVCSAAVGTAMVTEFH